MKKTEGWAYVDSTRAKMKEYVQSAKEALSHKNLSEAADFYDKAHEVAEELCLAMRERMAGNMASGASSNASLLRVEGLKYHKLALKLKKRGERQKGGTTKKNTSFVINSIISYIFLSPNLT